MHKIACAGKSIIELGKEGKRSSSAEAPARKLASLAR